MKILVIAGSHRKESQSSKVARFVEHKLGEMTGVEASILDLSANPLRLWDESVWEKDPKWNSDWKPMSEKIRAADGYVVVSPEWGGMVPAGLKNLFLFVTGDLMAHKPATIVAVSSTMGGSYPVAELRMSSYKNSRVLYLPDHVLVRNVEGVLNEPGRSTSPDDERIQKRIQYSLEMLIAYAKALGPVREVGVSRLKEFSNGM